MKLIKWADFVARHKAAKALENATKEKTQTNWARDISESPEKSTNEPPLHQRSPGIAGKDVTAVQNPDNLACARGNTKGRSYFSTSPSAEPHALARASQFVMISEDPSHEDGFSGESPAAADVQNLVQTPVFEVVTSPEHAAACVQELMKTDVLGLDTETTGLKPRTDRLRLVQIGTQEKVFVFDLFALPAGVFSELFAQQGVTWIGHNLKFDLGFLHAAGCALEGPLFDTMVASQLVHASALKKKEARKKHRLADVVSRELGQTLPKEEQASDWGETLTPEQLDYAARDARVLLPLYERFQQLLRDAKLTRAWNIEMRCLPALAGMEQAGLPMDAAAWRALAEEHEAQQGTARAQLDALTDAPANWNSWQQIKAYFARQGLTLDNTTAKTLKTIKHPTAAILVEYKAHQKRVSSFGAAFLEKFHDSSTKRLYPSYLQCGSDAGRMSCTKPNIQQIPSAEEYRKCFAAPDGRVIIKADYSQIELRIAAVVAKDTRMLKAYENGEDLHELTAAKMLKCLPENVTKEERSLAKAVNFGLLYGMGAPGLQDYAATTYGVAITPEEATQYRAAFLKTYPGIAKWHRRTAVQLRQDETVNTRTLANRRRLRVASYPEALNTPIQGTGADGLKLALAQLYEKRGLCPTARIVACVHDEIVVEVPQADAEKAALWVNGIMVAAMVEIVGESVPIKVDTQIGTDWEGTPLA